jgi:NNP family nitrate/nitrite transporter-like MFS transporter
MRVGHWPTLLCAFLYFDVSFMLWMLLGALGVFIAQEFGLSPSEKGLLVAVPVLAGALLRLVMGPASDRWGAKRMGIVGMLLTALPLLLGATAMHSFSSGVLVGALLGVAGASFAVALPLASRWYPPQYQGLAMGIAGAGNSGTVLAALFAPRLAEWVGWRGVFALALIPLIAVLLVFSLFARDNRGAVTRRPQMGVVLREPDLWWLNAFYAVTFGGFVGLASFLPIFFVDQYACTRVAAGTLAAGCVAAGSFLRPLGGSLADRFGGMRVLVLLYLLVATLATGIARLFSIELEATLLVAMMGCLGMGNGAVFQLVGQRFPRTVGMATGVIGDAGGVGGFLVPSALGLLRQGAGSYAAGFGAFAAVAASAAMAVVLLQRGWQRTWGSTLEIVAAPQP